MKWVKVKEMYKYANDNNIPLLSDFGSNNENLLFWDEYRNNYSRYDKTFRRYYNSFRYFMQEPLALHYDEEIPSEHIQEITLDFIDEVYHHLMINAKKYEELYRINVLSDINYSIVDNYDITETMNKRISKDDTDVYGERIDNTEDNIGARTDTSTDIYGSRTDTTNDTLGERTDTVTDNFGSRNDISVSSVAGFNSTSFVNSNKTEETKGQQSDSHSNVTGQQANSKNFVQGQQSDSHSEVTGVQENSRDFTKGSQTDTHVGTNTETYTFTRKGNIGVKTVSEMIKEHKEVWETWEFYSYIFKNICAELLLI